MLHVSQEYRRAPIPNRPTQRPEHRRKCRFKAYAVVCWPHKAAPELAARAGISQRTAERTLAGVHEASGAALAALVVAIIEDIVGHAH